MHRLRLGLFRGAIVADAERIAAALRYQQELEAAQRPATMNPNLAAQGSSSRNRLAAALSSQNSNPIAEFARQAVSLDPQPDQGYGTMAAEMALGFVPGVGQAMAARDIERARRDNDPVGMGMAASSFVPFGKLIGGLRKPMSELITYHGSPHRFPPTANNPLGEFDPMKIGTGEGAQAYGAGAGYLAEAKDVAKEYAKNLANRDMMNQGRLNAHANAQRLAMVAGDAKYAADDIRFVLENNPNHDQKQLLTDTLGFLDSGAYAKPLANPGNLYKVDLPDEQIAKMLDWDKPLSQQPTALKPLLKDIENAGAFAAEKVKLLAQQPGLADWAKRDLMNDAAQIATSKSPQHVSGVLKRMQLDYGISPDSGPFKNVAQDFLDFAKGMQEVPNMDTGGGAVSYLKARYGENAASKMLQEAGIPGIRYLDQGSRSGGAGTSNFVVFDPKHMNIIGRE